MNTQVVDARIEMLKEVRDLAAKAEAEGRDFTDDERALVADRFEKIKAATEQKQRAERSAREVAQVEEWLKAEDAGDMNEEALRGTRLGMGGNPLKSLGQCFVQGEQYKALMGRFNGGQIPETAKGIHSDPSPVPGGMKALLTSGSGSGSDAGVLVQPQQLGLIPYPQVDPKLRQIITTGTTGTDRIEYAQVLPLGSPGVTNAAKTVAEATGTNDGSGVKPESGIAFKKESANVVTVAHWMPATKRALSDAAQVRTLIDEFLRRGLELEIDRLILTGNEAAPVGDEEWNGILNTTGVQAQAWDGDVVRTIRRAIGRITRLGAPVTGVLVSPELDEELDLMRDANERYFSNGPFGQGPTTIWGRPRIVLPGLSGRNTFILGDFSTCVLWDREQASITVTDSHADFFIRNLIAILAEARAAFGIFNPNLLITGTETAPTP